MNKSYELKYYFIVEIKKYWELRCKIFMYIIFVTIDLYQELNYKNKLILEIKLKIEILEIKLQKAPLTQFYLKT